MSEKYFCHKFSSVKVFTLIHPPRSYTQSQNPLQVTKGFFHADVPQVYNKCIYHFQLQLGFSLILQRKHLIYFPLMFFMYITLSYRYTESLFYLHLLSFNRCFLIDVIQFIYRSKQVNN